MNELLLILTTMCFFARTGQQVDEGGGPNAPADKMGRSGQRNGIKDTAMSVTVADTSPSVAARSECRRMD